MSVHYKTYTSTSTSNSIASRLYGLTSVSGDGTPGASTNNISVKVNGVDLVAEQLIPTMDGGVAGSPMTYWFNLSNPSAGIPVSSFDITVTGTASAVLLFEPA